MDERRRVELLDDGRAWKPRARSERIAVVDGALDEAVRFGEVDGTLALRPGRPRRVDVAGGRLLDAADRRQAHRDELDRLVRRREAVGALVLGVEPGEDVVPRFDGQLVALTDVADVELPQELHPLPRHSLSTELLRSRSLEAGEDLVQLGPVELVQPPHDGDG